MDTHHNNATSTVLALRQRLGDIADVFDPAHLTASSRNFDPDRLILAYEYPTFDPWGNPSRIATISVLPPDGKYIDKPCIHVVSDGPGLYFTEGVSDWGQEMWEKEEVWIVLKKPFPALASELRRPPLEELNLPAHQYEESMDYSGQPLMYGISDNLENAFDGPTRALHVMSRWNDLEWEGKDWRGRCASLIDMGPVSPENVDQLKSLCERLGLTRGKSCPWSDQMSFLEQCLRTLARYHWQTVVAEIEDLLDEL